MAADDLVKAETCDRVAIIEELLFIIGCAICFIKYYTCIFSVTHGIWVTLNTPLLSLYTHAHTNINRHTHKHTHTHIIHKKR